MIDLFLVVAHEVIIDGQIFPEFSMPPSRQNSFYDDKDIIAPSNTPTNPRYHHSFVDVDLEGNLYRGDFILDSDKTFIRHGKGIMRYQDGSVYEGEWTLGEKQGYGRLINAQGDAF